MCCYNTLNVAVWAKPNALVPMQPSAARRPFLWIRGGFKGKFKLKWLSQPLFERYSGGADSLNTSKSQVFLQGNERCQLGC